MYRNSITNLIWQTKNNYYKEKLIKCQEDMKKAWTLIEEATNKNCHNNSKKQICIKDNDSNMSTCSNVSADIFR